MTAAARTPVRAGTWLVSDSRTQVRFTVRNLGVRVRGSIAVRCGEVQVDAAGAPVRVRAEFDLDSLDTGINRRDTDLRSITQGRGSFTTEFSHYQPVPAHIAEQIKATAKDQAA